MGGVGAGLLLTVFNAVLIDINTHSVLTQQGLKHYHKEYKHKDE